MIDAPYDALNFDDGWVEENKSVSFSVFLTDLNLKSEIYLLQEPVTGVVCVGHTAPLSVERGIGKDVETSPGAKLESGAVLLPPAQSAHAAWQTWPSGGHTSAKSPEPDPD